jgi:hypothetical protein
MAVPVRPRHLFPADPALRALHSALGVLQIDSSSTLSKTTLLIINELSAPRILLAQQIEDFQIQIIQQI